MNPGQNRVRRRNWRRVRPAHQRINFIIFIIIMAKKIITPTTPESGDKIITTTPTPESGENKQEIIQKTTNDSAIKIMKDIPEEAKIRVKIFLEKMRQLQTGKQN